MPLFFSTPLQRLLHKPFVQILLIILFGGLAYSNTFSVPFILDDFHVIVESRKIDNLSTFLASDLFPSPRWIALATLAINKGLGGLNVTGFHAVNLIIHLTTGIVVFFLAKTTLSSFIESTVQRYAFAPFVAALGFVLHPLHTQSVTYIVQRMTSLATLQYLCAILLYARTFDGGRRAGIATPVLRWTGYMLAIISCILAMSTKEISYTLPIILALYDVCFLKGTARERICRLAPFFVCTLALFFYLVGIETGMNVVSHGGGNEASRPLSRGTYLITELCVLVTYVRLLILPIGQNLDYDYPKFTSLQQPQAAAAFILIVAMVCSGIFLLKRSLDSRSQSSALQRIGGFAIVWFFITISIESGIVPLIDTIFEHRVYLPSVWFFIVFGMLICELYHRTVTCKQAVIVMAIALMAVSGYATYRRNHVWRDTFSLWSDVVSKSPNKVRGWTNLGIYFVNRQDPGRAIPFLERAVKVNPNYFIAQCWLGTALIQKGDNERALSHFLIATRLAPDYSKGWESAGRLLLEKGQVRDALFYLSRAQQLDPVEFVSQEYLQKALFLNAQLPHKVQ